MNTQFLIGCDPEIFVKDKLGLRSIIDRIGGTKEMPRPLTKLGDGFAVQEDNVAMEFNIPAAASKEEFVNSVVTARQFLASLVYDQYGWFLSQESAAIFPEEELKHPSARVFGCDPDYNAWTGERNPVPRSPDKRLRSCGGHVHIGAELTNEEKDKVIQAMDFYAGVPSIIMDSGEQRKQLYGKAGACRHKSYGVEYRTLSNFWIFEPKLIGWVYDQTARALDAVRGGTSFEQLKDSITSCINNNDKELAKRLCSDYELTVV